MPYPRGDMYRGDPGLPILAAKLAGPLVRRGLGLLGRALRKKALPAAGGAAAFEAGREAFRGFQQPGRPRMPGGRTVRDPFEGGRLVSTVPRGHHLNKQTYVTRGGGTSRWPQSVQVREKGTIAVRNRRMNVANGRAILRASRRMRAFARIARRAIGFSSPRPPKGRVYFKKGRRTA